MNKKLLTILSLLLIVTLLAACGGAETAPEPVNDPNYSSILEEDEEDPYDRSYGFPTEDPEDTADEAAEPEAEDAAGAASGEDAE